MGAKTWSLLPFWPDWRWTLNALGEITLSQLLGTEANVDAALHQIQGIRQKDNRV